MSKKSKIFLLAVVATTAFCIGVWFLVSPSINRQNDLEQQDDLLYGIMSVIDGNSAVYVIEETTIEPYGDYLIEVYEPADTTVAPAFDYDPKIEPIPDYAEVYEIPETIEYEPLDPAVFPSGIVGIGILSIESIDLRLPIMEGVEEPALRIAPGRVPQTAIIGDVGNAVIAGHRNFTFGSMFNRLGEVEIGDMIEFQAMSGEIMSFEVFELLVITPDNQIAFIQPQDEAIITLYTCTPIREATHRLLIRAVLRYPNVQSTHVRHEIEGGL